MPTNGNDKDGKVKARDNASRAPGEFFFSSSLFNTNLMSILQIQIRLRLETTRMAGKDQQEFDYSTTGEGRAARVAEKTAEGWGLRHDTSRAPGMFFKNFLFIILNL